MDRNKIGIAHNNSKIKGKRKYLYSQSSCQARSENGYKIMSRIPNCISKIGQILLFSFGIYCGITWTRNDAKRARTIHLLLLYIIKKTTNRHVTVCWQKIGIIFLFEERDHERFKDVHLVGPITKKSNGTIEFKSKHKM